MTDHTPECYFGKFSIHGPQCLKRGQWLRQPIGNHTDQWTWCAEHVGDSATAIPVGFVSLRDRRRNEPGYMGDVDGPGCDPSTP